MMAMGKMKMDEALASEISPSSIRGQYQSSIPELSKISKVDVPPAIPEVTGKGGLLSIGEKKQYDVLNRVSARGGKFERFGDGSFAWGSGDNMAGAGMTTQGQIKNVGIDVEGNYFQAPEKPNVPPSFEEYTIKDDPLIDSPGFSEFDESAWPHGQTFSPQTDFVKPIGQRNRDIQSGLKWQKRLLGR